MLPTSQPTSSFRNTQLYTDLGTSTSRLQYARYRDRGGSLQRGPHHSDYAYNSPSRNNMTPGEPYRRWFHDHISRNHYSLGEATDRYNDWLVDPQYGPEPPPRDTQYNRTTNAAPPPAQHQTTAPPDPPTSTQDRDNNSPDSASNRFARAQTIVQDVHTSPDDANAVLDSGTMRYPT